MSDDLIGENVPNQLDCEVIRIEEVGEHIRDKDLELIGKLLLEVEVLKAKLNLCSGLTESEIREAIEDWRNKGE